MTLVYVTEQEIREDGKESDAIGNYEFAGDTWMDALEMAYEWLKYHRNEKNYYHVWC